MISSISAGTYAGIVSKADGLTPKGAYLLAQSVMASHTAEYVFTMIEGMHARSPSARMLVNALSQMLADKYIKRMHPEQAVFAKLLEYANEATEREAYLKCAQAMKSKDALFTNSMLTSIIFSDASEESDSENRAYAFKIYAEEELEELRMHYHFIQRSVFQIGLRQKEILHLIIQYDDHEYASLQRMLIYTIQARYTIRTIENCTLYNYMIRRLAQFYLNDPAHRDFYKSVELTMLIADETLRAFMLSEVVSKVKLYPTKRTAVLTHLQALLTIMNKKWTDEQDIPVQTCFNTLDLYKTLELEVLENNKSHELNICSTLACTRDQLLEVLRMIDDDAERL